MNKFRLARILTIFSLFICQSLVAEVIDPESYIMKSGYHSKKMGDDGKTLFYTFTERADPSRIKLLESEIEKLPKRAEIQNLCDFMRGSVKAKLIADRGIAFDVAVTNYGNNNQTMACVLKYMQGNSVGTQLIYTKGVRSEMYMVFVTD